MTTQNIYQHHRRIDIWKLPLPLQDATSATINLGLPRLRIDALRIIQDDADNKAREASQNVTGIQSSYYDDSRISSKWS